MPRYSPRPMWRSTTSSKRAAWASAAPSSTSSQRRSGSGATPNTLAERQFDNPAAFLGRKVRIMDPNVQYLAEEVAENHRDGLLTRREAMRRLGYLGLSTMAASTLLAACGGDDDDEGTTAAQGTTTAAPSQTPTTAASGPTTTRPPVATQDVTYQGRGRQVRGVFAAASSPRGAVLVIHENRGISDFVKSITGRLAGSGFTALAVDLLSPQGGTAAVPDQAQLQAALGENATAGKTVEDMKSSLEELQRRAPNLKLGATGFCFGGNMTWDLLAAGDPPPVAAAVPFYGQAQNPDFSKTKAAVFAVYAEQDSRVNANMQQAKAGLDAARLTNQQKVYPGVPHAFMRSIDEPNSGNGFTQATAAYQAMVDWFNQYLR